MTEYQIYKLLLRNEQTGDFDSDFPNLQRDTVNLASKSLTNIIYESLKHKSSTNNCRRKNILKFINSTCEVKEAHIDRSTEKCLDLIQRNLKNSEEEELASFQSKCSHEMQSRIHNDISDILNKHYVFKKSKHLRKQKRLELIKGVDRKCLNMKYDLHVRKSISYYNAKDDSLRTYLANRTTENQKNYARSTTESCTDHKKSLIKLAYATMNLSSMNRESDKSYVFENILNKMSYSHTSFDKYEQNFLRYTWNTDSYKISRYMESFFFLLEHILLRHSTAILSLDNENEIRRYFVDLEDDSNIIKIRKVCREQNIIFLKLKSLLYELYYLSFCNENVLKLGDLVI